MTTSRETFEREFERNGEERIRRELWDGNLTGEVAVHASQWLGGREKAREARAEALAREEMEITRRNTNAVWAGVIVAVVSTVVLATIAWLQGGS